MGKEEELIEGISEILNRCSCRIKSLIEELDAYKEFKSYKTRRISEMKCILHAERNDTKKLRRLLMELEDLFY